MKKIINKSTTMEYKQNITINNIDYTAYISIIEKDKFKLSIIGDGLEYSNIIENTNNDLEIIKNAFRMQDGLSYDITNEGIEMTIKIKHSIIKFNNIYVLKKNTFIILEKLEENDEKIFPLTRNMFGEHIIFNEEYKNDDLYKIINESIIKYNMNQNENNRIIELSYDILDYYNITYHYQKGKIIPTKNEIVFNNIISIKKHDNNINKFIIKEFQIINCYTVLSCQKNNNRFIKKKGIYIKINYPTFTSNFGIAPDKEYINNLKYLLDIVDLL